MPCHRRLEGGCRTCLPGRGFPHPQPPPSDSGSAALAPRSPLRDAGASPRPGREEASCRRPSGCQPLPCLGMSGNKGVPHETCRRPRAGRRGAGGIPRAATGRCFWRLKRRQRWLAAASDQKCSLFRATVATPARRRRSQRASRQLGPKQLRPVAVPGSRLFGQRSCRALCAKPAERP